MTYLDYKICYIKYNDINYNRKSLKKFIWKYRLLYLLSVIFPFLKSKLTSYKNLIEVHGKTNLDALYKGEFFACKQALIEKWARTGSLEILINGKFSLKTYETISNLPLEDFRTVLKRTDELVEIGRSVVIQTYTNLSQSIE